MTERAAPPGRLRRELGTRLLAIYGIGGMLGGGIYALVGAVVERAGAWSWASFALAMLVAAPTALVYAALASRHPKSGGEARWAQLAFRSDAAGSLVGWLVLLSGIVSMATLARAFAGYVTELGATLPAWALALAFLGALGAVNLRGIRLTAWTNVGFTAIELSGLLIVVAAGAVALGSGPAAGTPAAPAADLADASASALGVVQGAALAFYAFIGFEDMVNVAEEVRRPRRAYPIAIVGALCVVGATYVAVVAISTAVVEPARLAASAAPLTEVVRTATDRVPPALFTVIALFAVANTALLNFVTASRLLFGMADEGLLPRGLAAVHARTRTPHRAIAAVLALAGIAAVVGHLSLLAGATSALLLAVFATVGVALARLRRAEPAREGTFAVPAAVPWGAVVSSLALLAFLPGTSLLVALAILVAGLVLVGVRTRLAARDRAPGGSAAE